MHRNDSNDRFFCMQTTRIHSQPCAVSILFLCFCVLFIDKQKGENEWMRRYLLVPLTYLWEPVLHAANDGMHAVAVAELQNGINQYSIDKPFLLRSHTSVRLCRPYRETDKKWHYSFRSSLEEELCALFSVSFINQIETFRLQTKAMAAEWWWRSDLYLVNTNKLSICFDLTPIIIIIIVDRIGDTRSGLSECVIIICDSI